MTWEEVLNVHRTLTKFPQKEAFLKSLYPKAFFETDITTAVEIRIPRACGGSFYFTYGEKDVATLVLREKQVADGHGGYKPIKSYEFRVNSGFSVNVHDRGTKIIKFGPVNATGGGKK